MLSLYRHTPKVLAIAFFFFFFCTIIVITLYINRTKTPTEKKKNACRMRSVRSRPVYLAPVVRNVFRRTRAKRIVIKKQSHGLKWTEINAILWREWNGHHIDFSSTSHLQDVLSRAEVCIIMIIVFIGTYCDILSVSRISEKSACTVEAYYYTFGINTRGSIISFLDRESMANRGERIGETDIASSICIFKFVYLIITHSLWTLAGGKQMRQNTIHCALASNNRWKFKVLERKKPQWFHINNNNNNNNITTRFST